MKFLAIISLCVVFVAVVSARPEEEEKYEDETPEVDVDEAMANNRLRESYIKCLEKTDSNVGCTNQAKKVKERIHEALTSECSKCTDKQKEIIDKILRYTLKNHPDEFIRLEKVHDPTRIYRVKYADRLKKDGIVLPD